MEASLGRQSGMGRMRVPGAAARIRSVLPQPAPGLIPRPRLIAALDDGAACRLIVIAAPDGFGKTSIAAAWARHLAERGAAISWVTFNPQDDEPNHIITRVAEAIASALPEAEPALATLSGRRARLCRCGDRCADGGAAQCRGRSLSLPRRRATS